MTRCSVIEYKSQHKLWRLKHYHSACKQETADTHPPSVYTPQTLHTHTRRQHPTELVTYAHICCLDHPVQDRQQKATILQVFCQSN